MDGIHDVAVAEVVDKAKWHPCGGEGCNWSGREVRSSEGVSPAFWDQAFSEQQRSSDVLRCPRRELEMVVIVG